MRDHPPKVVRSLRGRVVVGVLALLAVLLVALFVAVDLALAARLKSDLRTRLVDRVALARQLDGALSAQQLVDRLKGDGVQVELCSKSSSGSLSCVSPNVTPTRPDVLNTPPARGAKPPKPGKVPAQQSTVQQTGSTLYVEARLPSTGQVLNLSVDSSQVQATIGRLVLFEVIGGALALLIAALLLGRLVGRALRPLDDMTAVARTIAAGDRGRRLNLRRNDTELGRTAAAFDDMLDELESALDRAAAAQQRLRRFLGDASHELRSPLAGVQSTSEQLLRDEPDHAARERAYVALIRETRRAGRLVDDLLTVARFDGAEAPPLALEPVDLRGVAEHEAARLRPRARERDIVVAGGSPVVVLGDPLRLGQIVANLLDNAGRVTPPGGTIRLDVRVDDASAVLDVADTGPGIADADRERIFERLVRLDESRSRDSGGFGLGLAIARTLAIAHGGELRNLPSDRGALFRLTMPLAPSGQQVHNRHHGIDRASTTWVAGSTRSDRSRSTSPRY